LFAANLVFVIAHLVGAAVLCWAFRPNSVKRMEGLAVSNGILIP
jgi:uncharacterized protein (DUF2062 family)